MTLYTPSDPDPTRRVSASGIIRSRRRGWGSQARSAAPITRVSHETSESAKFCSDSDMPDRSMMAERSQRCVTREDFRAAHTLLTAAQCLSAVNGEQWMVRIDANGRRRCDPDNLTADHQE